MAADQPLAQHLQAVVDSVEASVAVLARHGRDELQVTTCNQHFFHMVGGRRQLTRSFPFPVEALVPRYARREFRRAALDCLADGKPRELEQAYDLKRGTQWWRLSFKVVSGEEESAQRLLVTGMEITSRIGLERELATSTSRFRSVVDAAYDGIVTIDQERRITLFNRAAEEMFGYEQEEVLGEPLQILLPPAVREHHAGYVRQFARSPVRSRAMDDRGSVRGLHRDGTTFPIEIAISKITVQGVVEFTAVIRDIKDRVLLLEYLQKEANTDALTGLPNRREFLSAAAAHVAEDADGPAELSVMILDVDHFKAVNDTHGHAVGDEVLQLLARVGAATVRHLDLFARYGGEEFVVLMPETDAAQALATAERVRAIFDRQAFEHDWSGARIPFTVSIGVTTRSPAGEGIEAMLERADAALYRAKERGRNRVEAG